MDSVGNGRPTAASELVAQYLSETSEGGLRDFLSPDIIMQGFVKAALAMLLTDARPERGIALGVIMENVTTQLSDLYGRDMSCAMKDPWNMMCILVSEMESVSVLFNFIYVNRFIQKPEQWVHCFYQVTFEGDTKAVFDLSKAVLLLDQFDSCGSPSFPGTDVMIQAAFTVRHTFSAYVVASQIKTFIYADDENPVAGAAFLATENNSVKVNFYGFKHELTFFFLY